MRRNVLAILGVFAVLLIARHGFAEQPLLPPILDQSYLPTGLPAKGRLTYSNEFLLGALPRAFAIGPDGSFNGVWGMQTIGQARDAALSGCAALAKTSCMLYAENLTIVWPGLAQVDQARAARATPPATLLTGPEYAFVPDPRFLWHGPETAKGLVVWAHGFEQGKDSRGLQPPAFLRGFNNVGYDVVRFDRDPRWDTIIEFPVRWLHDGLVELRRRGWRRVVAGGQSRGGINVLELLNTPGVADAIITTSAANSGTDPVNQIVQGDLFLQRLLAQVPDQGTRVAYVQFLDDPYAHDEDVRVERLLQMLAPKVGALLLIDRPDGFKGHMGAYDAAFAPRYAECLKRLVEDAVPPSAC